MNQGISTFIYYAEITPTMTLYFCYLVKYKIVDKEEFEQAISSWGCHFDTGKTLEFFAYVDKNGSKRIDFDEFLDFFSSEINITEESLRQVFSTFIGDEKGDCLTIEHLKKLNSVYSEDELKELIDATDRTHSGKVSFEDFYKMITTKV